MDDHRAIVVDIRVGNKGIVELVVDAGRILDNDGDFGCHCGDPVSNTQAQKILEIVGSACGLIVQQSRQHRRGVQCDIGEGIIAGREQGNVWLDRISRIYQTV